MPTPRWRRGVGAGARPDEVGNGEVQGVGWSGVLGGSAGRVHAGADGVDDGLGAAHGDGLPAAGQPGGGGAEGGVVAGGVSAQARSGAVTGVGSRGRDGQLVVDVAASGAAAGSGGGPAGASGSGIGTVSSRSGGSGLAGGRGEVMRWRLSVRNALADCDPVNAEALRLP